MMSVVLRRSANGMVLHEREFDFANHLVWIPTSKCARQILDLWHNRRSWPIVDHILNQLIDANQGAWCGHHKFAFECTYSIGGNKDV
jgi:hypothetical protein